MTDFAALAAPLTALAAQGSATPTAAEMAKRADIQRTSKEFEATFLSSMMQNMFSGLTTSAPFGGGPGEDIWKSFMSDAMAKQMSKAGGIGLSGAVAREMLKLQGLSELPA